MIGKKFWDSWWGSIPEEVHKSREAAKRAAAGEIVREECYYAMRDQSIHYADRTIGPVKDATGRVAMLVASGIDVSEQKALRDQLEQRVLERTWEFEQSNMSLRELSARLLQTQDEERRKISRELHGSVGQLLAALSMNATIVSLEKQKLSAAAQKSVQEDEMLLTRVSDEIRTLSYLLHPPLLDEIGLESAIRDCVDGFRERSKISVDLEMAADFGRLSKEAEIALFPRGAGVPDEHSQTFR